MANDNQRKKIEGTEDLDIYNLAFDIADIVWKEVVSWEYMAKTTLGKQLIRSSDSVVQNIAEGYGRFFYREKKLFCYYSRGSLYETKCSLQLAQKRSLIKDITFNQIKEKIENLVPKLNKYIQVITEKEKEYLLRLKK